MLSYEDHGLEMQIYKQSFNLSYLRNNVNTSMVTVKAPKLRVKFLENHLGWLFDSAWDTHIPRERPLILSPDSFQILDSLGGRMEWFEHLGPCH